MTSPWVTRAFVVATTAAVFAAAFLPDQLAAILSASIIAIGLTAAASMFIRRSQHLTPLERRAWRLVGVGFSLAAGGVVLHGAIWLLRGDVATFGPIDLIWLTGYAVGILGIGTLPHTAGSKWHRIRLLLDGTIGGVAVFSLLWALTLRSVTTGLGTAPTWARFVGTSYVALDGAVLVTLLMVVIKRSAYRFDRRLVLFGVGAIAQGLADYAFLRSGLGHSFAEAEPMLGLNIVAVSMFLAAAYNVGVTPREREYADRTSSPTWALVLPYGLALLLVGLMMIRFSSLGTSEEQGLLHAVVLVAILTITRQGVAIQESRRSLQQQRATLAASISHELKTPLTSIVGFLDLLDSGAIVDTGERLELISVVNAQAGYLARVVSDLMMLASDSGGAMNLNIESVPVDELAWRAVNSGEIDPSMVRVDADRNTVAFVDNQRIQHALNCLLGNAIRYGGSNIELVVGSDQSTLVLEVHDDGPGVPRKYELVIWEKFSRGPNHLNATVPGSGIGLAITRDIATAHGGLTGYRRSERLGGACFWIRLPARAQNTARPQPIAASQSGDALSA
ncbi:MAG: ATP-binding protein [Acidimicrobiia bacterium]